MTLRIVSVSGGKDSTALYLWGIEQWGKDGFLAVFADTGWEHEVTLNYLRNLAAWTGGPEPKWVWREFMEQLKAKGLQSTGNRFLDLFLWKGRVASKGAQFCTEHVKLIPIKEWVEQIRGEEDVIMYVGLRAGESEARSKRKEVEWSDLYDCEEQHPLLHWSEQQVKDFVASKGIPLNPLYEHGSSRVGCWPCIHASKTELAALPDWRWDQMANFEKQLGRSWFPFGKLPFTVEVKREIAALPVVPVDEKDPTKGMKPEPVAYQKLLLAHPEWMPTIEQVKEWARTDRGGTQWNLFTEDAKDVPSCMSTWGVCE